MSSTRASAAIRTAMTHLNAITNYHLTGHAKVEMARRQIDVNDVTQVLSAPEQSEAVREGRIVYQSRLKMGHPPQTYLLRVFVDVDRTPPEVVTVYRTSKITKYWRKGQ